MDLVQAQIRIAGGASLADLGLAKQVSTFAYGTQQRSAAQHA